MRIITLSLISIVALTAAACGGGGGMDRGSDVEQQHDSAAADQDAMVQTHLFPANGSDEAIAMVEDDGTESVSDARGETQGSESPPSSSFWEREPEEIDADVDVKPVRIVQSCAAPSGKIGREYSGFICKARGGDGENFEWSVGEGLPDGITWRQEGYEIIFSGTPSVIGEFSFVVSVSSAGTSEETTLTMAIEDDLGLDVYVTNGSERNHISMRIDDEGILRVPGIEVPFGEKIRMSLSGHSSSYSWSSSDDEIDLIVTPDRRRAELEYEPQGEFSREFNGVDVTIDGDSGNSLIVHFDEITFIADPCKKMPDFDLVDKDGHVIRRDSVVSDNNNTVVLYPYAAFEKSVDSGMLPIIPSKVDRLYKFKARNTLGAVSWEIGSDKSIIKRMIDKSGKFAKSKLAEINCQEVAYDSSSDDELCTAKCDGFTDPMDMSSTQRSDRIVEELTITMTDASDVCGARSATKNIAADLYPDFDDLLVRNLNAYLIMQDRDDAIEDALNASFSVVLTDSDSVSDPLLVLKKNLYYLSKGSPDRDASIHRFWMTSPDMEQTDDDAFMRDVENVWFRLDQWCKDCDKLDKVLDFYASKIFIYDDTGSYFAVYDRTSKLVPRTVVSRENVLEDDHNYYEIDDFTNDSDGKHYWQITYGFTQYMAGIELEEDADYSPGDLYELSAEPLPIKKGSMWHRSPLPGDWRMFMNHIRSDEVIGDSYIDSND